MLFSPEAVANIVAGLCGLLGALIGAGVSWWTTWKADERRYQREDARRFDTQRREAYASFLSAVTRLGSVKRSERHDAQELKGEWHAAFTHIELVAPTEVQAAAHNFAVLASEHLFSPTSEKATGEYARTRQRLIDAIRADLGLPPSIFSMP